MGCGGAAPTPPTQSPVNEHEDFKNLYPQVCSFASLYQAWRLARCGKCQRAAVADFEFDLERELLDLQEQLLTHTFQPGGYNSFCIREPKRRPVSAAPGQAKASCK